MASSSRAPAAPKSSAARAESDLSRYQIPGRVLSRQAAAQPSANRRYGHDQRGRVSVSVTETGPFRPAQLQLQARLHLRPVVVDHRVPRRVAPLAAAHELVLRATPSNVAPTFSSAGRERSFAASVLNSTRR